MSESKTEELKSVVYEEGKGFLSPTEDIIEDLRNGRMVILVVLLGVCY